MNSGAQSFSEATDLFGRLVGATNFVLDHWWAFVLLAALTWLGFRLRAIHALLGKLDERADAAFGDVDALLAERNVLIGNLAKAVRSFTQHEKDVIDNVLAKRVEALEAIKGAAIHADAQVAASLNNLFTVAENYPALASEGHYRTLRQDLVRIEERLTAARKFYNMSVEESNAVRRSFPANLIAGNMPAREKFSLGERRPALAEPAQIDI